MKQKNKKKDSKNVIRNFESQVIRKSFNRQRSDINKSRTRDVEREKEQLDHVNFENL